MKQAPITEEDRMKKMEYDAHVEGTRMDLGEDIELKETLAKKFHWKKIIQTNVYRGQGMLGAQR